MVLHVFTFHTAHTTTHCAQKLLEAHNTDFNSTICLATLVVRAVDDVKWLWKPDRKNSGRIDQQLKFENITSSQSGSNISDQINVEAGLSWLTWLASEIFYLHTAHVQHPQGRFIHLLHLMWPINELPLLEKLTRVNWKSRRENRVLYCYSDCNRLLSFSSVRFWKCPRWIILQLSER